MKLLGTLAIRIGVYTHPRKESLPRQLQLAAALLIAKPLQPLKAYSLTLQAIKPAPKEDMRQALQACSWADALRMLEADPHADAYARLAILDA